MLLSIIRYIKGYVKIRITGYSTERFLNACGNKGIYIWGLHPVEDAYEMYVSVGGFRKVRPIVRKTGTRVAVVGRFGLPFFLYQYRKRRLFFGGAFACIVIIYVLSLHIWSIDIRGNVSQTDESILTFLETKKVTHGMKKKETDCVGIVREIRKKYDDIIWVSASIEGTKLIVQVKENEDSLPTIEAKTPQKEDMIDIVADRDCVITKMITRMGVPMVKEGDSVKKGTILVCGRVSVNNDAGETVEYQYRKSDADIRGKAVIPYENEQTLTYIKKKDVGVEKEEYYLKAGSYRLGVGSRTHEYDHYEISSEEKQWRIGKNFYLPIATGKRVVKAYVAEEKAYRKEDLQKLMSVQFQRYCEDLGKKGVEILENDVKIYTGQDTAKAKGNLTVVMPIGKDAPTEVKEIEVKKDESGEQ